MEVWSVGVYTRIFISAHTLKKSLHSSQEHFILLIICRLLAWRVYATLHISSRVFTTKSGFRFCKMLFPCFNAFQIVPIYVLLIAGCHLSRSVKCCEDLWRVEASLHIANSLSYSNLWCVCEEWRLFCDFHFSLLLSFRNKQGIMMWFPLLQPYALHPASLLFAACLLMVFSLQTYGLCPAFI